MYYFGLEFTRKTIIFCVKDAAGHVDQKARSDRREVNWIQTLPQPRMIAVEATILLDGFTIACFHIRKR
jgi:transposase